ncbi:MAG: hypothetical protein AAF138_04355 [Planctomycetota bacterium]
MSEQDPNTNEQCIRYRTKVIRGVAVDSVERLVRLLQADRLYVDHKAYPESDGLVTLVVVYRQA